MILTQCEYLHLRDKRDEEWEGNRINNVKSATSSPPQTVLMVVLYDCGSINLDETSY